MIGGWTLSLVLLLASLTTAEVSLTLSTKTITTPEGGYVSVTFGDVPTVHRDHCWIGVFSPPTDKVKAIQPLHHPATAPWTETAPVKWIECKDADAKFPTEGKGEKKFYLTNMREDVQFWLFYGTIEKPDPIAKSAAISFAHAENPMQGHIARGENPKNMYVRWNSRSGTDTTVRWGTTASALDNTVVGTVATYTAKDLCGEPANSQGFRTPGYFHTAELKNLPQTGTIYYQFGGASLGWSTVRSFKALSDPSPTSTLHVSIVADMGVSEADGTHYHWMEPDAHETIGHVTALRDSTDLVLHIGDISYATGYAAKWDLFMSSIETVASQVPYMTLEGNHERDWPGTGTFFDGYDSGGECGVPTMTRFGAKDKAWYSFKQGPVHFVMINTEFDTSPATEQYKWMEKDLSSVNRTLTPWVVFSGHRPMYTAHGYDLHFSEFEELLYKYQVDLVLWGHVHYVSVTCPVFKKECKKPARAGGYDAPVHTVIGNSGMGLTPPPAKWGDWTTFQMSKWGYETMTVNATHLYLNYYSNEGNELHHTVKIERAYPRI